MTYEQFCNEVEVAAGVLADRGHGCIFNFKNVPFPYADMYIEACSQPITAIDIVAYAKLLVKVAIDQAKGIEV